MTPMLRAVTYRLSMTLAALMLSACSSVQYARFDSQPLAGANCAPRVYDWLYFGRDMQGRVISEAQWESFVAQSIAPYFPEGYTVSDASGQWRDTLGRIVREPSKVVELVHDGHTERRAAIKDIINAYKLQFSQESVLLVEMRSHACF
jgi:hypothetical protein